MKNRRKFLKSATAGSLAGLALPVMSLNSRDAVQRGREIWVGTVSQEGMQRAKKSEAIAKVLNCLHEMKPFKPDIICLPETFTFVSDGGNKTYGNTAEEAPYPSLVLFREFAVENNCYLICPINTIENGHAYNTAVVLDRTGEVIGEYKKAHTTESEMNQGISAGPLDPPVFDLDFGRIGIQICFDIEWIDGWEALRKKDVDIIFWPSAYSGGRLIQTKAWETRSHIVSSTIKGPARICDLSGDTISQTETWNRNWVCAGINLEKEVCHTWPFFQNFAAMKAKYGRALRIETLAEEEWSVVESLSKDVKVHEVFKEFEIPTYNDFLASVESLQRAKRRS